MADQNKTNSKQFASYKPLIDADIATHSQLLLERWQQDLGLETAQVIDAYLAVLARGGKRLRGSLGLWAYELSGGKDKTLATRIARSLEMIHAYLLVVDDVADQATTRRGGPSAHMLLEKYHQDEGWFGDARHFSQTQAVNAGLAAQHLVMQEITELATRDSTKLEALRELNAMLFKTVTGQIADINHQAIRSITEHEVIAEMQQKTAYYSFISPLQFGIIMAGKDWSEYAWLEQWALNIGLGFQINDDILGVFGDEKLSGKSTLDDIKEGKITLLVTRALDRGNTDQKNEILRLLGNQKISRDELERIQTIFEDTGALHYCQSLAEGYAQKAIVSLDNAPATHKSHADFLKTLSQAIVNRRS